MPCHHRTLAEEVDHLIPQAAAAPRELASVADTEEDHHLLQVAEAASSHPVPVREHETQAPKEPLTIRTATDSLARSADKRRR